MTDLHVKHQWPVSTFVVVPNVNFTVLRSENINSKSFVLLVFSSCVSRGSSELSSLSVCYMFWVWWVRVIFSSMTDHIPHLSLQAAASLLSSRLITSFNSLLSLLSWTSSMLGIFLACFFDLQLDCCCPLSSDSEFPWWAVRFCPVTCLTLDPEDSACFPCGFWVALVLWAFFVGFAIGSCNRVKLLVLF